MARNFSWKWQGIDLENGQELILKMSMNWSWKCPGINLENVQELILKMCRNWSWNCAGIDRYWEWYECGRSGFYENCSPHPGYWGYAGTG